MGSWSVPTVRTLQELIGVNLRLKPLRNLVFTLSLDPPKSPLRRGVGVDFEKIPVPPFLRGARGDLGLMVKQQSVTGFNVKLTPMHPTILTRPCRVPRVVGVSRGEAIAPKAKVNPVGRGTLPIGVNLSLKPLVSLAFT